MQSVERVVDRHLNREQRLAEHAVGAAAPVRRAAAACLADWRSAPGDRWEELLDVYDLALSRASFPAQRVEAERFVTEVEGVTDRGASPGLADAGAALREDLERAQRLFGPPVPICTIVWGWRRAGWAATARPAALRAVRERQAADLAARHRSHGRLGRDALALRRLGGRRALTEATALLGVAGPLFAQDNCHDPIIDLIDEGDTFCG